MISVTTNALFPWLLSAVGVIGLCVTVMVGPEKRTRPLIVSIIAIGLALYLFFSNSVTLL
jgi:hypothetical protein